jgi:hypothetical protein
MSSTLAQLSIFVENKKGRLFEVSSLLGENGINIRAITIAESEGFGILRIVVDRPDDAVDVLKIAGYNASVTDIVAVEVVDKPGGLAAILKMVKNADINVEYMYGFVDKPSDNALIVFRFDDNEAAIRILKNNKIKVK